MSSDASAPLLGGNGAGGALSNPDAKTGWAYESKVLMALSGPAIFQLAGQQGLVVTNQVCMQGSSSKQLQAWRTSAVKAKVS